MKRRTLSTASAALLVALHISFDIAPADEKPAAEEAASVAKGAAKNPADGIDVSVMASLTVVLRDESGRPIPKAEIRPYAMRMRETDGHGYWDQKVYGPPKTAVSSEQGIALIRYPGHVRAGPQILTTRLVTFMVTHSDFVTKVVHFDLGPEKAEITLEPGCEVELSAVGINRERIEGFGVLMAGPYAPQLWADGNDGTRRSRSIKDGTWQSMLVKLQQEGPTLFSNVVPLRVRPTQSVRLRNIPMRPGARVRGRLSEDVPRPAAGYVVATSIPLPAQDSYNENEPSLAWHDWSEVAADGSFEFESLPPSGELQLLAICEGWISSTTADDPLAGRLVVGQIFKIEDEEHSFVVKMERTGTLEVSVETEDGKPFTAGQIGTSPNQHYLKGGNTLLGQRFRSMLQIQNQLLPPDARIPLVAEQRQFPYIREVGPDGTVTLKGIPVGYREDLYLSHEGFILKGGDGRGRIEFSLDSAEPLSRKLIVIPAKSGK